MLAGLAFLSLAVAACDPAYFVRGTTRVAPQVCGPTAGAPPTSAPATLPGASVDLYCGERLARQFGVSGADGRFHYGTVGSLGGHCEVRISKEGYRTPRFGVGEHCSATLTVFGSEASRSCQEMTVYAQLAATGSEGGVSE